jgi:plasmid stability protein
MQEVMQMPQYTIRNIPDSVDRELRARARRSGKSLNE